MYQPKVNNTQKYEDSQGSHVVTTGKLLIIEKKKYNSTLDKPEWYKYAPIIISETEEIEEDDYFLNLIQAKKDGSGLYKHDIKNYNVDKDYLYKILALPEHFSDKHLQAIVDGKMEDDDEVLVKCSPHGFYGDSDTKQYWIHLDQQNHITLFPAKQSLEEAAKEYKNSWGKFEKTEESVIAFKAGAEWAKKNNY